MTLSLSEELATDEYIRERRAPRMGDLHYLGAVDLVEAIKTMAPLDAPRVLDYGCGGSPYRSLFSGSVYHRADLAGDPTLDFIYGPDGRLPAEAGGYDFVLSSQVLEHVGDPALYLAECWRVLKPGGQLLVTTHGTFRDHACPHDYWRWTAFGLSKLIAGAGFDILAVKKITTGPRAGLYLLEQMLDTRFTGGGWYGELLGRMFALIRRLGSERRHRMADQALANYRLVDANGEGASYDHGIYICVGVLGRKNGGCSGQSENLGPVPTL